MQTLIQTPTNDLRQSLDFYRRLEFKVLSAADPVLVTDGKALIEINPDRYARAGVKLYGENWDAIVSRLMGYTQVTTMENGYLLADSSGAWIYLINGALAVDFQPAAAPYSALGGFAGLSLETTDMKRSEAIWKTLGFTVKHGGAESGWVLLENGDGFAVSLMRPFSCPHLFFNPSLTYFNGKEGNPKVIQKIRDLGIPIAEEITHFNEQGEVDNIIIRDPGGYGFFIFND